MRVCLCVCVLGGSEHRSTISWVCRFVNGHVSDQHEQIIYVHILGATVMYVYIHILVCAHLLGKGVPSIHPLLSAKDSGLRLQWAQAAPASAPPSRPGFRCFFQKEIPPPTALPPRPQCLSPPGPRCSKLVPAQSFIDFKIEANSGLKKRKGREREGGQRDRESPRLMGRGEAEKGPEPKSETETRRDRNSQRYRRTEAERERDRKGAEQARYRDRDREKDRDWQGKLWKQKDL